MSERASERKSENTKRNNGHLSITSTMNGSTDILRRYCMRVRVCVLHHIWLIYHFCESNLEFFMVLRVPYIFSHLVFLWTTLCYGLLPIIMWLNNCIADARYTIRSRVSAILRFYYGHPWAVCVVHFVGYSLFFQQYLMVQNKQKLLLFM